MKKFIAYSFLCCILSVTHLQAQTQVTFYTTMGKFVVEMYEAERPITTKNFIGLVKKKFYDKIIFHRVMDGFMIQGGDPTGKGSGGSGVIIKDEFTPKLSNIQKTIAMANSGPNTGESQFFINLVDNAYLDDKHPIFGIVISNFSVVQAIGKVKVNATTKKPLTPVVMDSVRITSGTTGIANAMNDEDDNLGIFPNPVTNESAVWMESTKETTVQVSIYNQQGQRISEQHKKLINGTNTFSLNEIKKTDFSPGVYYLMVTDGAFISRKKFIILE